MVSHILNQMVLSYREASNNIVLNTKWCLLTIVMTMAIEHHLFIRTTSS
uniref:Uncharacterized protein n=1 Tax=Arundo donax TaxID=35708 RepID=A0A0A9EA95_ARUDO